MHVFHLTFFPLILFFYYFLCVADNAVNDTTEYWLKDLKLMPDNRIDILHGCALYGDIIHASQKLLSMQFPAIKKLQSTYYSNPFELCTAPNRNQIHHDGKYHWFTSSGLNTSRGQNARVFDSKWQKSLSQESEIQLAQIYGAPKGDRLHTEICPVHQQDGATVESLL